MSSLHQAQIEPQRQSLGPWSLSDELVRQILPRAFASGLVGIVFAVLVSVFDFNALGLTEMVAAASFWAAAIMIVTFHGNVGRMLFWLLLLDASLALYQVSIYMVVMDDYVFLRLGPVVLAGTLFLTCSGGRAPQQRAFLYIIWVACNIPAFVSGSLQGYLSFDDAFIFFVVNVFYPLIFYYAMGRMQRDAMSPQVLRDSISVSVLVLCAIPLLLIPVELALRETESFASLQFGGRAYSVIGIVLLIWSIVVTNVLQWRPTQRFVAISLVVLVFATSFSRGAFIIFLIMLLGNFIFARKQIAKLSSGIIVVVMVFLVGAFLFSPKWLSEAGWFWLVRANMASNLATGVTFDAGEFFQTDRGEIWQYALTFFKDSPLWGYGIGSTPTLISAITHDDASYSGMHNLFLTVLVERGLIGLCGVLVLLGRIGYLIIHIKDLPAPRIFMAFSFVVFLLYANSTGVELFLNSTRSMNVTVTVYLFLLVGFLEYRVGMSRGYIQGQHVPATTG